MIPNYNVLDTQLEEVEIPSRTHKIIYEKDRVSGYTDNIEALKQTIYLILNTERYAFPIYSWKYGAEFVDLIGQPTNYAIPEIKRRISEALLQDDRILSVGDFEFSINKKKVLCKFVVKSIFGDVTSDTEVSL